MANKIEKPTPSQSFSMEEANLIQENLIKKSGLKPLDWINKNAFTFRKIIESNLDLFELYRKDPEAAEDFIAEQLNAKNN